RRDECAGRMRLLRGLDPGKDQSYFLHALNQRQLAKACFPIGHLPKREVRRLAAAHGLVTFDKKDSTGICFIGERDFRQFLQHYLPEQPGLMISAEGETVGEHQGLMYYTVGQRQGLGIGGRHGASGEPWYVVDKDLTRNILIVAQGSEHPALFHPRLIATRMHWIAGEPPPLPLRCSAKIRYRQHDQLCTVRPLEEDRWEVAFDQPQRAVTPGQSVVLYQGEACLGGGIIERACH
ncbi:MAG TPA: tRNA 2-thiouridine(34) synthase MnmA, partial [Candidatus Competibacteraceae bacterium]|nr:tRNA 2-thiouridine(34) synthase MnmA [Candidatus Competibacteraceae bacterium]